MRIARGRSFTGSLVLLGACLTVPSISGCVAGTEPCVTRGPADTPEFQDCLARNQELRERAREEERRALDEKSRLEAERALRKQDEERKRTERTLAELRRALRQGQSELANELVSRVPDVNVSERDGYEPLHLVEAYGTRAIAEALVSRGADVDARDRFGVTPLHYAQLRPDSAVADLLTRDGAIADGGLAGEPDLRAAVQKGNTIMADLLIARSADVHVNEGNGGNLPISWSRRAPAEARAWLSC